MTERKKERNQRPWNNQKGTEKVVSKNIGKYNRIFFSYM